MNELKCGDIGQEVESLQKSLGIKVTGIYDVATMSAVRDFQVTNNLPPTCVADADTLNLLLPKKKEGIKSESSND
jgi:peptidoglycan hydrolase-like protein with peptidoglycan-binding domain